MISFTLLKSFIQLRLNKKKTREQILDLQEKKFRKILKFAYKKSNYYNRLYSSHGLKLNDLDTVDIEKIPIITKQMVMDNFDELLTVKNVKLIEIQNFLSVNKTPNDLFKNKYHIVHSSGSSGKLGIFLYSKKDWDLIYPYVTRMFGFSFKKRKSVFFGAIDGHYSSVSSVSWSNKGFLKIFSKSLFLDIKKPIEDHIKKLNEFKPDIICSYSTGLKILARQQEKGLLDIKPNMIINTGEGVNLDDKKYIKNIFNAPFLNSYGLSECSVFGFGKEEYGGIALNDDIVLVEIKDNHFLLTSLFNKTQPLIRYRIDDFLTVSKKIPKDFPFTVINDVIGRDECVIWFKDDKGKMDFIHPIVIAEFFVNGLDKHQIIIKSDKSFEFLAVINKDNKEEIISKIKEKLNHLLAEKNFTNVRYEVKIVNSLNIDEKTGKFKLVLNKQ